MKSLKILPLLALLFLSSCEEKKESDDMGDMAVQAEVRDPAEANKQWVDAWNRNNAQELDTLTSADAVLYMEGDHMNADGIRSWYKNATPMMKDLKTTPEVEYATTEIAYEAGTYSFGIKSDSLNNVYEGTYTFIWKKVNNDWKLQVMNIAGKEQDTTAAQKGSE